MSFSMVFTNRNVKRSFLLAGAALAALAVFVSAADAETDFTYTGGFQTYTVPETGKYEIKVAGASGGEGAQPGIPSKGGYAAEIKDDFDLTQGEVLRILVGGEGGDAPLLASYAGGGGGGGHLPDWAQ
jgi:Glycine rich protein